MEVGVVELLLEFVGDDGGTTMVEYGLLIGLIAAVTVVGLTDIGNKFVAKLNVLSTSLT